MSSLSSKLISTAGFALVAGSGIILAKPRVEALTEGTTEKKVAQAALVFFVTLALRACLTLVWGIGLGSGAGGERRSQDRATPSVGGGGGAARPRRATRRA